jgi:hypothetical protein
VIGSDEWDRRAALVGIEWVETPTRSDTHTPARCLACGHEWSPRPSHVNAGTGCPERRRREAGMKRRGRTGRPWRIIPPAEWCERAHVAGIQWVDSPPLRGSDKTLARCLECGHEWLADPFHISNGHGCRKCADAAMRVTPDEWVSRANRLNLEWIDLPSKTKARAPIRCRACGNEWDASPTSIAAGKGCFNCRRISPEEWNRRASLVGIEWLVHPSSTAHSSEARCLECGHEWRAWPSNVSQGTGCPSCAGRAKITRAEWDRRAAKVGIEWLETPANSQTKTRAKCLGCGHEWLPSPSDISQGHGCLVCSGRAPITPRAWDQRAAAAGIEWLETPTKAAGTWPARCLSCGHEWSPRPPHVNRGHGCPACTVGGFNPTAPGIIYLVVLPEQDIMKVGVSSTPESSRYDRISVHTARGWQLVRKWRVATGFEALRIEDAVLTSWVSRGARFVERGDVPFDDGWTECVHTGRVDVPETERQIESLIRPIRTV